MVAFGNGLYGYSRILNDPRSKRQSDNWQGFIEVKPTRQSCDKIPVFTSPKYAARLIDFDAVHPEFRKFLRSRCARERMWQAGAAFHLVVPIPDPAPYIHPIFITTPEDHDKAQRHPKLRVNHNTASLFYFHDPDWNDIFEIVRRYNPHGIGGISSFNEHREQPAYDLSGVINFITAKKRCPFDVIVQDPLGEPFGVCSSHPQFRVPLRGERPLWVVLRHGSISVERWLQEVNSPFDYDRESAAVAPTAVRKWAADEMPQAELDRRVLEVRDAAAND